jgi:hypothetical protein
MQGLDAAPFILYADENLIAGVVGGDPDHVVGVAGTLPA